jgi:hypothetical protein
MFAKARAADDMDLVALGAKLAARKAQLMGDAGEDEPEAAGRRPRSAAREAGMMARGARR